MCSCGVADDVNCTDAAGALLAVPCEIPFFTTDLCGARRSPPSIHAPNYRDLGANKITCVVGGDVAQLGSLSILFAQVNLPMCTIGNTGAEIWAATAYPSWTRAHSPAWSSSTRCACGMCSHLANHPRLIDRAAPMHASHASRLLGFNALSSLPFGVFNGLDRLTELFVEPRIVDLPERHPLLGTCGTTC